MECMLIPDVSAGNAGDISTVSRDEVEGHRVVVLWGWM